MTSNTLAVHGGTPTLDRREHRVWPQLGDDEKSAVLRVLDRGVLSGASAPESVAFERELGELVGARHALLTSSGTSALHLALAAAGVSAGDHVIVPAYSFVATPLSVLHAGAIPIFADVDETTGLMRAEDVAEVMTSRTRAIMPVHIHGCAAELGPLLELAEDGSLVVVEDAAQAHGATWNGRPVGAIGACGGFSLQSSKNLGVGEGGFLVTNDDAIALAATRMRSFGQDVSLADRDSFEPTRPLDARRSLSSGRLGWMYRGAELMAAVGRAQLAKLVERTERCQRNAERLSLSLRELPGVHPPHVPRGSTSVHHKFRVRLDTAEAGLDVDPRMLRDVTMRALLAEGLEVVMWQTAPLPAQPLFQLREGFGAGWPWSTDRETDFAERYDVARFPKTQRLLDSSFLLFSQSCPLIAQESDVVSRYAEAFARVWEQRFELVRRAQRG